MLESNETQLHCKTFNIETPLSLPPKINLMYSWIVAVQILEIHPILRHLLPYSNHIQTCLHYRGGFSG